ncbi:mRNA export protein Mep33 [Schizosaccharomyces japonicus yFS275]|uniref:mRNA export protein Mep33 n=1 Tax=Schizosaccharomyces japonicus (strain yFS275 / FY16936) TaxID=402676 RepID=B6JYQ0_SCHJY|nr:mRNA export protein Mep33 [Schizosaccharomyces japonicus yFS275]EEB06668.1 mRNA export protein Mep33 [Schizosaccharomyces japonicus yFS275]
MPPKKNAKKEAKPKKDPLKKAANATFGLKNKNRSTKVQAKIRQIEENAKNSGRDKRAEALQKRREEEKRAAEQAKAEVAALFKPVPKKKPVQNANITRFEDVKESQRIDLYRDVRDDTSKLPPEKRPWTGTDIVCMFFLEAAETGKYGWLWQCPNGNDTCIYRHALPQGYILQKDRKKGKDDKSNQISLEEFIEIERHRLGEKQTPLTEEVFAEWKKKRLAQREAEAAKGKEKDSRPVGKSALTGREYFERNKDAITQSDATADEENWDFTALRRETEALEAAAENQDDSGELKPEAQPEQTEQSEQTEETTVAAAA